VQDLGDVALIPGLVNPHTHLELTCYAGKLPSGPLWPWLGRLIALRMLPGQVRREQRGVADGAWQSLRAGVTCVGDISRRNVAWDVLADIPIRKVCFVELLSLADHPPRTPAELRAGLDAVREGPLLTAGVSPHAPYTVTAEHVTAAIELAAERGRPWTAHWAETPEEIAFLAGDESALPRLLRPLVARIGLRPPRCAPAEYLERCVGGRPPGLLAHGNYFAEADFAALARAGHTVVYCPRAHQFFQHPPHPLAALRAAGVPVVFGTDSAASNTGLGILDELQFVAMRVAGAPPADELLRLATLGAAGALGLADRIGTLEPGKQADLAAFACDPRTMDPVGDLIARPPAAATAVWVAGQRVV
jgi:cytosine/adenosine deaminase-related metal-dependent hydrolase